MKVLYFDCFSGISGDMILGALLDAGFDGKILETELSKLKLAHPPKIKKKKAARGGIVGTKFSVEFLNHKGTRAIGPLSFKEIKSLIGKSRLKPKVKELSVKIFTRIAEVEGKIHGVKSDHVQFHELGSLDSIVDIVGAVVAVDELEIKKFYSSKLVLGEGFIESRHGKLPVPVPATLALLKGAQLEFSHTPGELVTPTGAAILMTLCDSFGYMPPMKVLKIGYGVGSKDFAQRPNLLRILIAEVKQAATVDKITVVQTNIDDLPPLGYERLFEKLLAQGALDVYLVPVQMKKSRPGILLSVLCDNHLRDTIADIIFNETTTFGMRYYEVDRYKLKRRFKKIKTKFGSVRVKIGSTCGDDLTISPEYDDCKKIAEKFKLPIRKVYEEAKLAYRGGLNNLDPVRSKSLFVRDF